MKRFITRTLILSIATLCFVFGIMCIIYISEKDTKLIVPENKNILVIGDSHAECSFNDSILSNYYNIALSGRHNIFSYAILKNILANNSHIDTVVLSISPDKISKKIDEKWLNYVSLERHLRNTVFITQLNTWDKSVITRSDFIVASLRDAVFQPKLCLKSILHKNIGIADLNLGGYNKLKYNNLPDLSKAQKAVSEIDTLSLQYKYLMKINELCNSHKVKLILISTPVYKVNTYFDHESFNSMMMATFPHIEYVNLSDFPLKDNCYGDEEHLNHLGADIFCNYIKKNGLSRDSIDFK